MRTPRKIRLIHWHEAEAEERAAFLRAAGYEVEAGRFAGPPSLRALRESPPDAVVIDLSRIPSQGRDAGMSIRAAKATRAVPLVFVEGDPEKVAGIREHLPDAVYSAWKRVRADLRRAIAHPPSDPVTPRSSMDAYSGRPLVVKLGIRPGDTVALLRAPGAFEALLDGLPATARLTRRYSAAADLVLWFVHDQGELTKAVERIATSPPRGSAWIAWPKKRAPGAGGGTSPSAIGEKEVRGAGLARGLVDYKICSIDATWSGLLFTVRKRAGVPRPRPQPRA
ncbi:MAG: hypothetical protein ACE15D_04460 [Candidatus Eisenbacteria bacterium]|nr:hypothetical protein [Candidatus Eisenbacteria bacterium]